MYLVQEVSGIVSSFLRVGVLCLSYEKLICSCGVPFPVQAKNLIAKGVPSWLSSSTLDTGHFLLICSVLVNSDYLQIHYGNFFHEEQKNEGDNRSH
jgi:hypothetical protein